MSKVFIIGNGFDLDLGWKTRYSDFARSNYWKRDYTFSGLKGHLEHQKETDKWFDLEKSLLEYARKDSDRNYLPPSLTPDDDKQAFDELTRSLSYYLNEEQQRPINRDSVASQVLKAVISNGKFDVIYSFNYTDLHHIAKEIGITEKFNYEHVHGCLKDNSIILGVEDESDLMDGYSFLYKTFSPHYESHHIQYDLLDADEVVFFGHSLGQNDYHYFRQFFRNQCDENMPREKGKKITIFTYDDSSRISILEQLRDMNDRKTSLLFSLNDFQVICTKDGKNERLLHFLKHLQKTSKEEELKQINRLASML